MDIAMEGGVLGGGEYVEETVDDVDEVKSWVTIIRVGCRMEKLGMVEV